VTTRTFRISVTIALAAILVIAAWYYTSSNGHAGNPSMQSGSKTISIDANYVSYGNVDQLDQGADLIIIGTPTKSFEDREHVATYFDDGILQDFYTLTEIKIDRVIKSPEDFKQSDSLTIIEPIGYVEDEDEKTKITYEGYTELPEGQKSIIFLKKNTFGQYGVINMDLGKFSLEQGSGDTKATSKEKFRQAVLEKYDLTNE